MLHGQWLCNTVSEIGLQIEDFDRAYRPLMVLSAHFKRLSGLPFEYLVKKKSKIQISRFCKITMPSYFVKTVKEKLKIRQTIIIVQHNRLTNV